MFLFISGLKTECNYFSEVIDNQEDKMGTPGSGRKRTPVKDRFSAEDEALSSIAREVCLRKPLLKTALPRCQCWENAGGRSTDTSFTELLAECLL